MHVKSQDTVVMDINGKNREKRREEKRREEKRREEKRREKIKLFIIADLLLILHSIYCTLFSWTLRGRERENIIIQWILIFLL